MDKHERIVQFEARYAEDYGFEAVMVAARQRLVLEVLEKIKPRVVLEVGCGLDILARLARAPEPGKPAADAAEDRNVIRLEPQHFLQFAEQKLELHGIRVGHIALRNGVLA